MMKALTIWLTGLPCSGKTTLANLLFRSLLEQGMTNVEVLDGDVVRTHLSKGLGFSHADRDTNILRIGWVCQVLTKHGVCASLLPCRRFAQAEMKCGRWSRRAGGPGSFVEVWVRCGVEECIRRDVKGMYAKALRGEIQQFTGVSDPYEEPLDADIVVDTSIESPAKSVSRILEAVNRAAQ